MPLETKHNAPTAELKQPFFVEYGAGKRFFNVTLQIFQKAVDATNLSLRLPACDVERAGLLGDPIFGTVKSVIVHDQNGTRHYDNHTQVDVSLDPQDIFALAFTRLHRARQKYSALVQGSFATNDVVMQMLCLLFIDPASNVMLVQPQDAGCTALVLSTLLTHPPTLFEPGAEECKKALDNRLHFRESFAVRRQEHVSPSNSGFDVVVASGKDVFAHLFDAYGPSGLDKIRMLVITNHYSDQQEQMPLLQTALFSIGFRSIYVHSKDAAADYYQVWCRPEMCRAFSARGERLSFAEQEAQSQIVRIHQ